MTDKNAKRAVYSGLSRRDVLAGMAGAALVACGGKQKQPAPEKTVNTTTERAPQPATGVRMPVEYVPHGGGPWPFVDLPGMVAKGLMDGLRAYLEGLPKSLPAAPRAVLVVSGHWEQPVPTVMTAANPPLYYDYSGFPPAAYALTWPAKGALDVAGRVQELLGAAGLQTAADDKRGYDHGTFVVTKLAWPDADLPTTQLSLKTGLDPAEHLAIGRALAPLRDEGVFILGSGMSYHNFAGIRLVMQGHGEAAQADSKAFDDWMAQTAEQPRAARESAYLNWAKAPSARACHPREEHLLPLMVIAGAAGDDAGRASWRGDVMGFHTCAVRFG